jgi:GT2 family glycosyltransferase
MPETPEYSICLLTYSREKTLTARCKELACLYGKRPDVELCILDNGSTDGTSQVIAAWRILTIPMAAGEPGWTFVADRIRENIGFGPGFNRLVGLSTGKVVVLLSDDVRVFGDFLGLVGNVISSEGDKIVVGQTVVDHPAGWNQFGPKVIPYLYGHILAMKRNVWGEIGGFDPLFVPAGYEDVDFSYQATLAGYKLVALPELPVRHESLSAERYEHTVRMKTLFAAKWGLSNIPERP